MIDREKAEIGVLLSFTPPTSGIRSEAASAGFHESSWGGKFPRIQLLTVGELLDGKSVDYPHYTGGNVTHRRARRLSQREQADLSPEAHPLDLSWASLSGPQAD